MYILEAISLVPHIRGFEVDIAVMGMWSVGEPMELVRLNAFEGVNMFGKKKKEAQRLFDRGMGLFLGEGTIQSETNTQEGLVCIVKAALKKNPDAIAEIAEMVQWSDLDIDEPNPLTQRLLLKSAAKRSSRGQYLLAEFRLAPLSFASEAEQLKALKVLEQLALKEYPDALFRMAEISSKRIHDEYQRGKSMTTFLLKAAEAGHVEAQNRLASCYASGEGVPEDHDEAFRWWDKAVSKGHPEACRQLAKIYAHNMWWEHDYPVKKDISKSEALCGKADVLEEQGKIFAYDVYRSKYEKHSDKITNLLEPVVDQIFALAR